MLELNRKSKAYSEVVAEKTASGRRTATIITRRAPLKILLKKNMARIVISNEIEKQAHK